MATCTGRFAARLMLHLFLRLWLSLSALLPQVSPLLWAGSSALGLGDFIVEKHREALGEAIILCSGFSLLMLCCLLIFLFPKYSDSYFFMVYRCAQTCLHLHLYVYTHAHTQRHTHMVGQIKYVGC